MDITCPVANECDLQMKGDELLSLTGSDRLLYLQLSIWRDGKVHGTWDKVLYYLYK